MSLVGHIGQVAGDERRAKGANARNQVPPGFFLDIRWRAQIDEPDRPNLTLAQFYEVTSRNEEVKEVYDLFAPQFGLRAHRPKHFKYSVDDVPRWAGAEERGRPPK
ncbi:hypothetical protein [Mycobacterium sp. E2733]|uniref:hypothetical protein n=1 Tax=Mycobacterium sp. E2733 TaxID=1834138 RepID=UPI0012EABDFF|nr:hypothetical protein [Mycobacterium sp. E2733]